MSGPESVRGLTDVEIAAIATAVATKAAALAAAEVLATATAAAATVALRHEERVGVNDHDDFIRLQGQVSGLRTDISTMKIDVLAAVGRVDDKAKSIASDVKLQNGRVGKLETHWVQGAAVIAFLLVAMPLALAVAAIYVK